MRSLAVQPGGNAPKSSKRIDCGEYLLRHGHGAFSGRVRRQGDLRGDDLAHEGEQAAVLDDEARDGIATRRELLEPDALAGLQAQEHGVVAHELAEIDVVARVDGGEARRYGDANARPALGLGRCLAARPRAFALAAYDGLEVAVRQRKGAKHPLAPVHEPRIGVDAHRLRTVIEAHPGGRHDVGVDVVEQVLDAEIGHAKGQPVVKLTRDEVQILGQVENALRWLEANVVRRSVAHHTLFDITVCFKELCTTDCDYRFDHLFPHWS